MGHTVRQAAFRMVERRRTAAVRALLGAALLIPVGAPVARAATVADGSSASAVATAAPQASGGGCSGWLFRSGFNVKACINAGGLTVNTDGYATGTPGAGCYVQISLLDEHYNPINSSSTQACTSGRHVGPSQVELLGTYYSEMCTNDWAGHYGCAISPALHMP
jgi:hypothetical protein